MKSNYEPLGKHIRLVDYRNSEEVTSTVLGISIDKEFMPSVANVIGTDLSRYKLISKGLFACNPMHVGRDERLPIALYEKDNAAIVSPAYFMFEIIDRDVLNEEYLMMWFRRPEFDRECWFMTDGSVRGGITWDDLCRIKLPVPSYARQCEIVESYRTITDRIALKRAENDNLEAQLSGVYHRFFDAPGNSVPGLISDLGEVVGGATPSTDNPEYFCDDGIAWISPKDLTGTGLKFIYRGELCITESAYNSCSTKLMPAGTVLFTSRAPVGTIAIAMNDICTNQGFKSVIPKKEIGTAFVYYFLKENKQLIESHASGTTFMEVSGTVLKSIPAIVPKPEVASRFAAICMPLFEEQRQNELEIGRLQELRQTLISSISSR